MRRLRKRSRSNGTALRPASSTIHGHIACERNTMAATGEKAGGQGSTASATGVATEGVTVVTGDSVALSGGGAVCDAPFGSPPDSARVWPPAVAPFEGRLEPAAVQIPGC